MTVDVETLAIVAELRRLNVPINQEICVACHQPTIYILNDKGTNRPVNCGAMKCMRVAKDRLTRDWP